MSIVAAFSLGLAAASSAAAVPAIAALPAAQCVAEDAELLRLGDELPAALDTHLAAQALEDARRREGWRRWPTTPEELLHKGDDGEYLRVESWMISRPIERNFDGGAAYHKGEKEPRLVRSRYEAVWPYRRAKDALASKWMARNGKLYGTSRAEWEQQLVEAKPLADIAEAYYGECERIHQELDWEATWKDASAKATALGDLVTKIMAIQARTMEGVLIKGQALAAWDHVRGSRRMFHPGMSDWGPMFASDVLRLAATKAA